jgi:hypothetical protein
LYLAVLFDQLIANLTESRWFNVLTCEFTIMTIATVALGRTLLDLQKNRQVSAPIPQSSARRVSTQIRTPVRPRLR